MQIDGTTGSLTNQEKRLVKALLAEGWKNQEIQNLVNSGRKATINSGRVTQVKQDNSIVPASNEELNYYKARKKAFDSKTRLNLFDDERLIRSREAMMLAVQIFNSPMLMFKTEVFCVLVNIAWTYLMHEHYNQKKVPIVENGRSLALSEMLARSDCPLSEGIKRNLIDIKKIRDVVEHHLLRRSDPKWYALFQACCLNYEKTLCQFFGEAVSLQKELSFALQFTRLSMEQTASLQNYEIPETIVSLDASLSGALTEEQVNDLEYQFKVVYTLNASSRSRAHIQFVNPGSEAAEQIHNILIKYKPAHELYPYKATSVVEFVSKGSGKPFTSHTHTNAWRRYKIRPGYNAKNPSDTNKDYCIFHPAFNGYTYSDQWIELLLTKVADENEYAALRKGRT